MKNKSKLNIAEIRKTKDWEIKPFGIVGFLDRDVYTVSRRFLGYWVILGVCFTNIFFFIVWTFFYTIICLIATPLDIIELFVKEIKK